MAAKIGSPEHMAETALYASVGKVHLPRSRPEAPLHYVCPHCNGWAFLLTRKPLSRESVNSTIIRHLDGSLMAFNAAIVCESCHLRLNGHQLTTSRVRAD